MKGRAARETYNCRSIGESRQKSYQLREDFFPMYRRNTGQYEVCEMCEVCKCWWVSSMIHDQAMDVGSVFEVQTVRYEEE